MTNFNLATKITGTIKNSSLIGVFDTTLCDQVCQWLVAGRWFSPGTPDSSTNKTDRDDITEILLKGALNTINYLTFFQSLGSTPIDNDKLKSLYKEHFSWWTASFRSHGLIKSGPEALLGCGPFITDSLRVLVQQF